MYLKKINLKNKIALVTGAGKGIGRACSIALAEAGATIIGVSRTTSDLDKLQKDIKKVKGKLVKITCDIMDYDCLLYTSPSPRDSRVSRMPSSA